MDPEPLFKIPSSIKKVGVFVDEPVESLLSTREKFRLDMIQLHGNESPEYCRSLKEKGFGIIKSIMIGDGFKYPVMEPYSEVTDLFLFDTKGMLYGGSGMVFDWRILEDYPYEIPYLLSGGISLGNIEQVVKIRSKYLLGVDVNSRFEKAPGIKDVEKLRSLKEIIAKL